MNWYKKHNLRKEAQHSNAFIYTSPRVDYSNNYGNNYVDFVHVLPDPYYKQKDDDDIVKRNYEYFLDSKFRINKRTAINAVNRLAKAINMIINGRRKLKDALESDEYTALRRLLKSLVVESEEDAHKKEILLESLVGIERFLVNSRDDIEEVLPACYNNVSIFVDTWVRKREPFPSIERKVRLNSDSNDENTFDFYLR